MPLWTNKVLLRATFIDQEDGTFQNKIFSHPSPRPSANLNLYTNIIAQEGEQGAIPWSHLRLGGNNAEDIAEVRVMGFAVDDDNEAAPENIPTASAITLSGTTEPMNSLFQGHNQKWRSDLFVNPRNQNGGSNKGPSLLTVDKPAALSILEMFLLFFGVGCSRLLKIALMLAFPQERWRSER